MKAKEIRELTNEELAQRLKDEREQLGHITFQHAVAEISNPIVLRKKRRLIARMTTILNERTKA